jgi:D-alanine-D-alanine ligase
MIVTRAALSKAHPMPPPYVVKPIAEGSSVGVEIVRDGSNSVGKNSDSAESLLVEPYVPGHELTVGVMSRPGEPPRALGVTEILYSAELFDYTVKYAKGHATHILPAKIPEPVYAAALRHAERAHEVIGCAGVSRSDFRWDDSKPGVDGLFFLEINTQPGMTPISLVPEQAGLIGMSYGDLVSWMVEAATCRH